MGSMVIFHCNYSALNDQVMDVILPIRKSTEERKLFFRNLMLDGFYDPAYVIQSDDLDIAFDCGNGYVPKGVECVSLPSSHTSTNVGDIVVVNGSKMMLVMPVGFEEI